MEGRDSTTWPVEPGDGGDPLDPGARVSGYVIGRLLGRGGFGLVYEAAHPLLERKAAVKVLHRHLAASPSVVARFLNEARAVSRVRHPSIVEVLDVGELGDGRPYLVMELVCGETLDALVARRGRLGLEEAVALVSPICDALDAAHAAGVVHRDVKPANVMIVGEGRIKLLDFGVAKLIEPAPGASPTTQGTRLGSAHAMAPEQIAGGPIDARTDVYALGCVLFKLLAGRFPFEAPERHELERLHLDAPPPRPSRWAPVPTGIEEVVLRCLEKQPERRPPSAGSVKGALRRALDGEAPAPSAQTVQAFAIYLEARAISGDDGACLAELVDVLAAIEGVLAELGFQRPIRTGGALLAVRPGEHELDASGAARLGEAAALHRESVVVAFGCRRGTAVMRDGQVVGGELLRLGAWSTEPWLQIPGGRSPV